MQITNKITSIRRSILSTTLGFTFVVVLLVILYISNLFFTESKQQINNNITSWANYIAELSVQDVQNETYDNLASKLDKLKENKAIQYVDIYKYHTDNKNFGIVVIYDAITGSKSDPSTNRLSHQEKDALTVPLMEDSHIKLVTPIISDNKELGYVYIQMNLRTGLSFNNHLMIVFILLFFVLLMTITTISFKLENIITTPLRVISTGILNMSQTKDYTERLKPMPYKEADILARNINNFLIRIEKNITKLEVAEQHSLALNIELENKVAKRSDALKESNQELLSTLEKLHQYQDHLVESEKMASLGDMVAGVAHEVNTPIGLGVTASTLLSDRLLEIKSSFDDKSLKSSQLKKFLYEGEENVGIIYRNLKRAAELISSFKKVAVDQSSEEFRQFNFAELFDEILLTLAPKMQNSPYKISLDCPSDLLIVSKPGPINQIMINLILNSIAHGFDEREHGSIQVTATKQGELILICYQDDGIGISPAIKDKIFEPFITTKRGEGGSGLGLHLVYNLVTQALGGNISLDSDLDKGARFEISFPISEQLL